MVQDLLKSFDLPEWLTTIITERSQGNPFFVEEIVHDLIEVGALRPANGSWQVVGGLSDLHVPDTVQGVIAARIDRLDPALKHTLQHAAMIGRTFWQQLLAELVDADVSEQLAYLSELDFVQRFGRAAFVADWEWIFRHVMVREVAHDSVLKETRRPVHAKIARWLEREGADRVEELAPALARHYVEGQIWDKAINYLTMAGKRSQNLFALSEAQRFYEQALALIEAHPEATGEGERLELLEKRGVVRGLAGDFDGAIADLDLVLRAAKDSGNRPKEQAILISQGMIYRRADDYEKATSRLSMALDAARESGDQRSLADVLFHLGSVVWSRGENLEATGYHQQALDICRREELKDLVAVQATHGRAEAYYIAGELNWAITLFKESLELARQIGDRSYEAENLQMIAMLNGGLTGIANYELCLQIAEESLQISRGAHLDWHISSTLYTLVEGYLGQGEYRSAFDYLKEAHELAAAIGAIRFLSLQMVVEGQIYLQLNRPEQAEALFRRGLQLSQEANTYLWTSRTQAGLAMARLWQGDLQVGPLLEEALAAARLRGLNLYEVHCFEGLAELALAQGAYADAERKAESMLASAEQTGQREKSAIAYRLRGEARIAAAASAGKSLDMAADDLEQAHSIAQAIGAPYLLRETHGALAWLYQSQGDQVQAETHTAARRAITRSIVDNLQDDELTQGMII
jgi:predicted ATPase